MSATDTAFLEKIKSFEGRTVSAPTPGPDPVNVPMVRHLVEALEDRNPVYLDETQAKASVHGGLIAPPTSLQVWVMQGLQGGRGGRAAGNAQDELLGILDEAGFSSVVATNCEQEYHREIRPGDHLSMEAVIESVSEEKQTGLGVGHFVTTRQIYRDQDGNHVADMLFRILKFKPASKAAPKMPRPRPAITHDTAFFFEGAKEGKLLIQRCTSCGTLRHPPEPACPKCQSYDWNTVEASGRGEVYSFVINHYPQVPAFDYPLAVALIELEEGPRLVSNVIGCDPHDVYVGMKVQAEFVRFDDDLTLPQFRPVEEGAR